MISFLVPSLACSAPPMPEPGPGDLQREVRLSTERGGAVEQATEADPDGGRGRAAVSDPPEDVQAGSDNDPPVRFGVEAPAIRPLSAADFPPRSALLWYRDFRVKVHIGDNWRAARTHYAALIEREALDAGVPAALVDAVMAIESRYNSESIGAAGEVGLMQVMPSTARMLGFNGTRVELALPAVNVRYGARYLAGAWRLSGGDICTAAMKYRAGHRETRFSPLSVVYCSRIHAHLAATGALTTSRSPSSAPILQVNSRP